MTFLDLADSILRYTKKAKADVQIRRLQNLCEDIWMQFDANAESPLDSTAFAAEAWSATCVNFLSDALCHTVEIQFDAAVRRTVRQERYDLHRRLDEDLALHSSYAHSRVKEGLPTVTCKGGLNAFLQTEANKWRVQWTSEYTVDFTLPRDFRPTIPRTA